MVSFNQVYGRILLIKPYLLTESRIIFMIKHVFALAQQCEIF